MSHMTREIIRPSIPNSENHKDLKRWPQCLSDSGWHLRGGGSALGCEGWAESVHLEGRVVASVGVSGLLGTLSLFRTIILPCFSSSHHLWNRLLCFLPSWEDIYADEKLVPWEVYLFCFLFIWKQTLLWLHWGMRRLSTIKLGVGGVQLKGQEKTGLNMMCS